MALYSKMIAFHPFTINGEINPAHDGISKQLNYTKVYGNKYPDFEQKIIGWLQRTIIEHDAVILIAPGHKKDDMGEDNLVRPLVDLFIRQCKLNIQREKLIRTIGVQKSTEGGARSIEKHVQTIELVNPAALAVNFMAGHKVVYIIDDVYTTGATMEGCKQVVNRDLQQVLEAQQQALEVQQQALEVQQQALEPQQAASLALDIRLLAVGKTFNPYYN